ncbi:basic-leucine zipper bzip transcription factor [Trichoderma cornu-damae]|uniref:Basic-leucine zipper bzip transcription factor n=1 Tax=Trichoderma cornu-damae TaxID=654480 RepID=A0A9P8QK20_9HYPO|nr:basic-leucine zipper bzip transcription factor [Trichoderma cornu-damae]
MAPTKRPYEPDTPDEPRHAPGLHQPSGLASGPHTPMVTPPRSLSQPLARPMDAPHAQPPTIPPPGDLQGRPHGLHTPSQFPHGNASVPPSRPLSRVGGTPEGAPAWPEILRRQGGSFVGLESQQAYMTLPGSDTPIPVQVDYSQASKKADEKRQRNAKASTRHRRKKKTLQEENMKQLQELKEERQQMLQQLEELAAHRDFYREDRNRLRDLVARTPAISNHAAGPLSPVLSKSISLADRSPLMQPHHIPTPTQGYVSEVSSAERPVPVRRTDDRPEFSPPVYGALPGGPPHGLPSMHSQAYGPPPPRPSSATSSASGERLPPLRVMEGPPPPMPGLAPGQPQEQDLRTGQWRAAQPSHLEIGWATAPRKHQDGPHW